MNVELTEEHWSSLRLSARLAAWVVARERGVDALVSDGISNAAVRKVREQLTEWEAQQHPWPELERVVAEVYAEPGDVPFKLPDLRDRRRAMAAEFEVYKRSDGQWDWRLKASNGLVLGGSSQGYTERNDAVEGLQAAVSAIANDILVLGGVPVLEGSSFIVPVGDPEDPDATFEVALTAPKDEDTVEIVD